MDEKNISRITTIHLLGFQIHHHMRIGVFFLFIVIYCVTICGNLLIITLVSYSKSLHSPMYFFLTQLSVSDMLIVTDILPNMLHVILVQEAVISLCGCFTQFLFFAISEASQCFLLMAMSYDRYVAICKPLHYAMVMSHRLCWTMVVTFWTLGVFIELSHTIIISQLPFCGPNIVDHFFCDLHPILELSCTETTAVELEVTLLSAVFVVIPFFIIIVSYVYIIATIFKIPSITGRRKVFSTCSSHLTVVCVYYGTMVCVYLVPSRGQYRNISKFLSLLYTVVTPLINPIIYSLRNKDLKKVVGTIINNFLDLPIGRNKCCG
ncbi:olfactory receptor 10A7-like [Mantella aurantiaca]